MPYLHSDGYTLPLPSPYGSIYYGDESEEQCDAKLVLSDGKVYVEHDLDEEYYGTFYIEAPGSYADLEFEVIADKVQYVDVLYSEHEAREKFEVLHTSLVPDSSPVSSDPVNAKATQLLQELGLR